MGGVVSGCVHNDDLVDKLKAAHYIRSPSVERVLRAVDRADYMLPEARVNNAAYRDEAWKKNNLHLSAPCIYAQVLEGLELREGDSFLNIGSGTGYLSTMAGLIVGPWGLNHGVDIHSDIVSYAYDRLNEFKSDSPAIDFFSFCEPVFIQGNGLCITADGPQYDKVYCGATCPSSCEFFVKSHVKVGGILVMPSKDKLVRMKRISEDEWETDFLLSVAFATLILPDAEDPPASITLSEFQLPTLQELSRESIRSILRQRVNEERPELLELPVPLESQEPDRLGISIEGDNCMGCRSGSSDDVRNGSRLNLNFRSFSPQSSMRRWNQASPDYQTKSKIMRSFIYGILDHPSDEEEEDDAAQSEEEPESMEIEETPSVQNISSDQSKAEGDSLTATKKLKAEDFLKDNKTPTETSTPHQSLMKDDIGKVLLKNLLDGVVNDAIENMDDILSLNEMLDEGNHSDQNDLEKSSDNIEESQLIEAVGEDITEDNSKPKTTDKKREKFDSGISEDLAQDDEITNTESDTDSDDDSASEFSDRFLPKYLSKFTKNANKEVKEVPKPPNHIRTYSGLLCNKIQQLPLPPAIKLYVNLDRNP